MTSRSVERVFVIEDDLALCRTLSRALEGRFETVRTAHSVAGAVVLFDEQLPDLLIMDVELPDGSAVDVMREVMRRDAVPLAIAMSGQATPTQGFELAQLGVRTYLTKPLTLASLERAIDEVISKPVELGPHIRTIVGQASIHEVEAEVRGTMLREAIGRSGGNRRGAARLLQISRQLIQHMLRRNESS